MDDCLAGVHTALLLFTAVGCKVENCVRREISARAFTCRCLGGSDGVRPVLQVAG